MYLCSAFDIDTDRKRVFIPLIAVSIVIALLLVSASRILGNIDCQRRTGHPCEVFDDFD